jgi:hypothetical protein
MPSLEYGTLFPPQMTFVYDMSLDLFSIGTLAYGFPQGTGPPDGILLYEAPLSTAEYCGSDLVSEYGL